MSGIAPYVVFHVNQIYISFTDDIGNFKQICGTGFWVNKNGRHYFVTNAHNIDPRMKLGPSTKLRLDKLKIRLRTQISGEWIADTTLYEVDLANSQLSKHPTADVVVIENVRFIDLKPSMTYSCFKYDDLASQQFFATSLNPMDIASFIGFPGKTGIAWYDEIWNLAIARTVNIASYPRIGFSNSKIETSDVMLVSGLSFSGSSGSPVISHEKGIKLGEGLSGCNYVPPKLIGIMSGHHWSDTDAFLHSGLSYLTRSTAILEMLA